MADRNWEQELADIDRRLASVPEAPAPPARGVAAGEAVRPASGDRAAAARAPAGRGIGSPAAPGARSWRTQIALLLRVLVGAGALAMLLYWPYGSRCGAGLAGYLALVGVLALVGLWTSVAAWRHRAAFVHLLGLALLTGAGVLAAREVLPKVGYAIPLPDHPATWSCG